MNTKNSIFAIIAVIAVAIGGASVVAAFGVVVGIGIVLSVGTVAAMAAIAIGLGGTSPTRPSPPKA